MLQMISRMRGKAHNPDVEQQEDDRPLLSLTPTSTRESGITEKEEERTKKEEENTEKKEQSTEKEEESIEKGEQSSKKKSMKWPTSEYILVLGLFVLYFGLIAAQVVWVYFYFDSLVIHPNPRRFINSTNLRWTAYKVFMYLFGSIIAVINLYLWGYMSLLAISGDLWGGGGRYTKVLVGVLVPLFSAGIVILTAFSPPIFLNAVTRNVFEHKCLSEEPWPWGAQVVLDGRGYKDPLYVPSAAVFTTTRANSQGGGANAPLFTYDLDQHDAYSATFWLQQFDAPEASIDPTLVPALRSIVYDFRKGKVNGTCVLPGQSSNASTPAPCVSGTFSTDPFAVDIMYNLPERPGAAVHGRSHSDGAQWTWFDGMPSLVLVSDAQEAPLLETATTRPRDCSELKVCLAGSKDAGTGGPVGPETLVPLGLMMAKQAAFALWCTTPSKKQ